MKPWGPERPIYLWLLLTTLVLNVLSGTTSDAMGLPISPDRLTLAAALGLLVLDPWAWRRQQFRVRPAHVAMVACVAWVSWSALSAGTLFTAPGFFALADRLAVPFLLFTVAPFVFCTAARRDLLLQAFAVLGLYLGVTAVLEQVAPVLVVPSVIVDPAYGIQVGRSRGPFLASEAMGLALVQCGAAAAFLAVRRSGAWRLVGIVTATVCAVGVFLTLTRSVWLGLVVGVVVACLQQSRLRRVLPMLLAVGAVTVVAILSSSPTLQTAVEERATTTRSVDDRRNVNEAALRIIEQRPLTGVGWQRFVDVSDDEVRQADNYPITNIGIEVHNVPLGRAAETGIPGAALWALAVVLGPVLAVIRRTGQRLGDEDLPGWRLVLTVGAAAWGVALLLSPVSYPFPNYALFLVSGVVLAPYLSRARDGDCSAMQRSAEGRTGHHH